MGRRGQRKHLPQGESFRSGLSIEISCSPLHFPNLGCVDLDRIEPELRFLFAGCRDASCRRRARRWGRVDGNEPLLVVVDPQRTAAVVPEPGAILPREPDVVGILEPHTPRQPEPVLPPPAPPRAPQPLMRSSTLRMQPLLRLVALHPLLQPHLL